MPTLSQQIADFTSQLSLTNLPPEVNEKARTCVLNAFGMGLNGLDTPYARVAREDVLATDGQLHDGATLRAALAGERMPCCANPEVYEGAQRARKARGETT